MRLKDDMNLAISALFCRRQRGANLRRMMAVIVNHGYSCNLPANLEATIHSAEIFERFLYLRYGDVQADSDGNGCSGIQYVVDTRNVQAETAEIVTAIVHAKQRLRVRSRSVASQACRRLVLGRCLLTDPEIRIFPDPVTHH